ncbi:hypothetical protein AYI69_g7511 [Smittium culicis]|uniref:Uncharacterized protein n=1 Tax=Smittium culicis TaxID=133412 RepID=A0A1R1XRP8_9FUNG|nr:hypothetical protein AYI69_g7511 [Smittium culicis]
MQSIIKNSLLVQSEHFSEFQTRECKFYQVPDYLYGWRRASNMTSFLGAIIVSKVALNDPKYHTSKVDYNELGPASIHSKQFN